MNKLQSFTIPIFGISAVLLLTALIFAPTPSSDFIQGTIQINPEGWSLLEDSPSQKIHLLDNLPDQFAKDGVILRCRAKYIKKLDSLNQLQSLTQISNCKEL